MRRVRDRVALAVIAIGCVATVLFVALTFTSERRREAAVAQLRRPPAMDCQAQNTRSDQQTEERAPETPGESDTYAKHLAVWERVFDTWDALMAEESTGLLQGILLRRELLTPSQSERAVLEAFLDSHQDFIRALQQAAALGGPVRQLDFTLGRHMDTSHWSDIRLLTSLLAWDALNKAAGGELSAAVSSIVAGMELGHALGEEPLLYSHFARFRAYEQMGAVIRRTLDGGSLPPAEFDRLLTQIRRGYDREAFAEQFRGMAHLRLRDLEMFREGDWDDPGLLSLGNQSYSFNTLPSGLLLRLYTGPAGQPFVNSDEADFALLAERIANAAAQPYYRVQTQLNQIDSDIENLSMTRVLTTALLSGYRRQISAQAEHEVRLDLLQLGLAIEQHRAVHGTYPDSLASVSNLLGDPPPIDPFTGQPYHYEHGTTDFLLYSVGRDQADDGGQNDPTGGDLLWRGSEKSETKVAATI